MIIFKHNWLFDLFIPHEGNNYHPHSLHSRRLAFHALSIIAIKGIVVFFAASFPLLAWMSPESAREQSVKVIALTNELRHSLNVPPLKENIRLDEAAAKKVEDMFMNQYFAHTNPIGLNLDYWLKKSSYNYLLAGENLAMGYNDSSELLEAWKSSPTHYKNLIDKDYSEIGVSLAGGTYSKEDTIFAAQYFAAPASVGASVNKKPISKLPVKNISKATVKPNPVSEPKTKITIDQPAGDKSAKVVKIETVLPPDTKAASMQIFDNNISLAPLENSTSSDTWAGQQVISINESKPETVVMPVLATTDNSGTVSYQDINSAEIKPQKTSVLAQYWLYKNHPNNLLAKIFNLSALYFKIILAIALISLFLNIFIHIKKQHPRIIISGLGLIVLLSLAIIW